MLAIRLQRRGRKGLSQFRVILQDSHRSPFSGKVIAYLGSYDPHTKKAQIDKEKIEQYLKNGAQPSNRVAMLLKSEGVKLPKWVVIDPKKTAETRNPEKLRKNQPQKPAEPKEDKPAEAPDEEKPTETEAPAEAEAEEKPKEEAKEEPEQNTEESSEGDKSEEPVKEAEKPEESKAEDSDK